MSKEDFMADLSDPQLLAILRGQFSVTPADARAELKTRFFGEKEMRKGSEVKKPTKKRVLSPEARARIAAAQKKRWAKVRKEKAATNK
jgi:hypothetical protein